MNQERLLQRFIRYVSCDSESRNEAPFCKMIEEDLAALGLAPQRQQIGHNFDSNGWNVYASLPGEGEAILFCAHLDTVAPGNGIKPIVEDGMIRTGGDTILGGDDKSGVAAVMEALTCIMEEKAPNRPVEVFFTIGEEIGMLGAKFADYSGIESKRAVVLDNTGMGVIVNRSPAHINFSVKITGKGSHAGVAPDKGINALKAAVDAISNIQVGFIGDLSVSNVANLLAPGKVNTVPEIATFNAEIRSFEEETLQELAGKLEKAVYDACEKHGATGEVTRTRISGELYVKEDSTLIQDLQAAIRSVGITPKIERTFGGCDATWLNANGIAAANISTGMTDVHSLNESLAVKDLVDITRIVYNMMKR